MNTGIIDLCGEWLLVERPLHDGPEAAPAAQGALSDAIPCHVPGDVSDSLVRAGRAREPLVGLNFQDFDWVNDRSWWFSRNIEVPAEWSSLAGVELSLDGLDFGADIWLNGVHVGRHESAFYPFVGEVGKSLHYGGTNTLLVRLTTGRDVAEPYRDDPLCRATPTEAGRGYPDRGMRHRIFLRKPAYTWGWDWGPPLATCGITGRAALRPLKQTRIEDISWVTTIDGNSAIVDLCVEAYHDTVVATRRVSVEITFTAEDDTRRVYKRADVALGSGTNYIDVRCPIDDVRLWWPNGSGKPHLYRVAVEIDESGVTIDRREAKAGLRTIEMVDESDRLAFLINGRQIFLKGGNWVPSDSLYGRITDARLTILVEEAAAANFNCLRIWGGGRYEAEAFYDACDQNGILVWHDFMSACAGLPADRAWFYQAFEAEARYQIRRLRSRPCLLLWCGNNEVSFVTTDEHYWAATGLERDPGWALYHELLPRLVRELAPHLPYRPTSPYGGSDALSEPGCGDSHHWLVMRPESNYWSNPWYWDTRQVPVFNSEYGYGGPCGPETTREYLGSHELRLTGNVAREHTNTFYDMPRINFSIREHYRDVEGISPEEFLLLGGLCQGLNLGYSLESMRANSQTNGAIFWMYADTWGEIGWTIIDYYLRRKISYYNVKRCLAPQRLLIRRGGEAHGGSSDELLLIGLNDGPTQVAVAGQWGYQSHDGKVLAHSRFEGVVPPFSRAVIATTGIPREEHLKAGTVVCLPDLNWPEETFEPVSWLHAPYREMQLPDASPYISSSKRVGECLLITVASDTFAHGVHFAAPGSCRPSDNYFDLFPGVTKTVTLADAGALDPKSISVMCVNGMIQR